MIRSNVGMRSEQPEAQVEYRGDGPPKIDQPFDDLWRAGQWCNRDRAHRLDDVGDGHADAEIRDREGEDGRGRGLSVGSPRKNAIEGPAALGWTSWRCTPGCRSLRIPTESTLRLSTLLWTQAPRLEVAEQSNEDDQRNRNSEEEQQNRAHIATSLTCGFEWVFV